MTVLFTASKFGDQKLYKHIIDKIKEMGHQVRVRPGLTNDKSVKDAKFKSHLQIADFVVAEVTHSSISVGLEIATAISKNKHVVILCSNNKSLDDLSDFVRESSTRYTHIKTYTEDNLDKVIEDSIEKIRKHMHFVLYVELPNKYGDMISDIQKLTSKSKKQIIQEALVDYLDESKGSLDK